MTYARTPGPRPTQPGCRSYPACRAVILQALKTYGMILADNGSDWYISGTPGPGWDDNRLVPELSQVKGSDFEAVDESSLMVDPNSGVVKTYTLPPPRAWLPLLR
jgi:hypothetical protein